MAWLAASDSGRFTAPNLFYLWCLSLIISCQETDNRGKEAFWLSQVLGSPEGFRGLKTSRLGQSQQVPLGWPPLLGVLSVQKQHGFSEVPWQHNISLEPIPGGMDLCVCVDSSFLQTHCSKKPRTSVNIQVSMEERAPKDLSESCFWFCFVFPLETLFNLKNNIDGKTREILINSELY